MMSFGKLEAICSEMIKYGLKRSKNQACIEFTYLYYQSVKGIALTTLVVFCHWDLPEGVVKRVTPALYSSRYPIIICCEQNRQQRTLNYSCSVARCQCFACLGRTEIPKSICLIALTTCCSSRRCFGFYMFSCSLGPDHNFL